LAREGKVSDFVEGTFLLTDARNDCLDFAVGHDAITA
jgi:hypothetical protein